VQHSLKRDHAVLPKHADVALQALHGALRDGKPDAAAVLPAFSGKDSFSPSFSCARRFAFSTASSLTIWQLVALVLTTFQVKLFSRGHGA